MNETHATGGYYGRGREGAQLADVWAGIGETTAGWSRHCPSVCGCHCSVLPALTPPASDTSSEQHEATLVAVVAENAAGCVQGSAQWHLQNYLHTARFTTTHSCEGGGSSTSLLEQEVVPSSTERPLLHVPSRPHPHSRGVQLGAPTVWWHGMTALHGHRQTLKHSSAVAQVVGCALRQM